MRSRRAVSVSRASSSTWTEGRNFRRFSWSRNCRDGLNDQRGINVPEMPGGDRGLVLPQGFGGGQQLAVQVGGGEGVAVGQIKLPHPDPGQELRLAAPQAAQARHQGAAPPEGELLRRGQAGEVALETFREDAGFQGRFDGLAQAEAMCRGPGTQALLGSQQKFPFASLGLSGNRSKGHGLTGANFITARAGARVLLK